VFEIYRWLSCLIGLKHARESWVCSIWMYLCRCAVFIIRAIATQVFTQLFSLLKFYFLFFIIFYFLSLQMFSSSWRCFDVNWHLDGLYPILAALIHSYVKIKFCTWCLQVAPSIWEFVVYLINVLCSFEQSELGHKAGADLEGGVRGVRPLKFAKHMLYNVN
jgi:hypothetical protein